jgi:hypothetical protein
MQFFAEARSHNGKEDRGSSLRSEMTAIGELLLFVCFVVSDSPVAAGMPLLHQSVGIHVNLWLPLLPFLSAFACLADV